MTVALRRRDVDALVTVLALSRAAWGAAQLAAPRSVASQVMREPSGGDVTVLRMKGGRDLTTGLGALLAGTGASARPWIEAGVVVDAVDTLTTVLDRGRALRPRTVVLGSLAGLASVAIGVAALEVLED